jgi:lipid-A-disaccharide synthase
MNKSYKLWIFAGETSGDIYGARLAREARALAGEENIQIAGMGGVNMKEANIDILVDSTELGVVGLIEVLKNIFKFIRIFKFLEKKAVEEKPDAVVLIDYPGFNIRFAKSMYKKGIPVIWYISPQVWAWRKSNIPKLATYCSKMMVIFPFEPEVYAHTGLDVEFVGHPLVDVVAKRRDPSIVRDPSRVLLLPGSRGHEIERLLQPMLETALLLYQKHPELKFAISATRPRIENKIKEILNDFTEQHKDEKLPEFELTCGETSRWMQEAGTGLAASGTVTVECAIAGLPLVIVYKLENLAFQIAKRIITLFRGFFGMPNIIANKEIFKEFLQDNVEPVGISQAMEEILPDGERRKELEDDMAAVTEALSVGDENPSRKAAQVCLEFIDKRRL